MRLLRGLIAIIALGLLALFSAQFTETGRDALDRLERVARMALNQAFFRADLPLPATPDLARLKERLADKGLSLGAPVFIRILKKEATLEIFLKKGERFELFASYPICFYSGRLGPKQRQGDRQAPEGFYSVGPLQMNPNSRWHRSFNLGYPNLYDRGLKRSGDFLMVHGGCSSIGCYAMTNPVIDEIWSLTAAALKAGQGRFQVQALPFRLTERNMQRYATSKWAPFWQDLKKGYDLFEETGVPPLVSVCNDRYAARAARPGSTGSAALAQGCTTAGM